MLKCPHPTCPYVFDPSQVPAGVVLSCPRCGMQFTLGPPVPPPGHPQAPRPPAPPAPERIDPEFEEVGRAAVEERDPYAPRPGRRTHKLQPFILAGVAAVLMAGTALAIFFALKRREKPAPTDSATVLNDRNISIDAPPPGWTTDDRMKVDLGSPYLLCFKRESPEAHVAFGANEPKIKGRAPNPNDMRDDLRLPLRKLFDSLDDRIEPVETKWLGEPIAPKHGFTFRAQSTDGLTWRGEAFTVAHKGIAYYWLSWCGDTEYDAVKSEFAAFRGKFKLLDTRKDWAPTASSGMDYKGDKVPYIITDAEELWKEVPADDYRGLKAAEPDLDRRLYMSRTPKGKPRDQPATATLSVYILEGDGDPLQVARKYAEDKETKRIAQASAGLDAPYTPPTFKERTAPPEGDPAPGSAPATTPYVRLGSQVPEAADAARLIVVSGLRVRSETAGDKIVVVHCWCEYTKRDLFETKFVQIAASLR
ncbi:BRcat domain-containing protein [Frigoriglobus tundricola]|nr:hypothetical protein [Frigoriglobus tundricola]